MPKWYKYLIVVAIVIFVICIIADILWVEKASATMEVGIKETRSPDGMKILGGAGLAFVMYGIVGLCTVMRIQEQNLMLTNPKAREYMKDSPWFGLRVFLFILFFGSGMGTLGVLIALGFIG